MATSFLAHPPKALRARLHRIIGRSMKLPTRHDMLGRAKITNQVANDEVVHARQLAGA